ncbi:MAG: hypothetical protein JWN82_87 [Candidatus Saccharibacteria bacterium]|nr:hypothetical protein [Candidatus Saccharibacteria bacterium]
MSIHIKLSRSSQAFIGLMLLYVALTFILPVSNTATATYHLSDMQYRYLLLIVKLPLIAAWSITFYSYRRLRAYAAQIKDTAEGEDFGQISRGVAWLAWGFAVPAVISSFLGVIANSHPSFQTLSSLFSSYFYLVVTLAAFSYIAAGIHKLSERSNIHLESKHIRYLILMLVAIGVLFCSLIAGRLHGHRLGDAYNSFYVPNILVWTTIVIPYLYAWFMGLFGALELILVARRTTGVIYRQALRYLAVGLVIIIISMSGLQYFRAIIPRNGHVTINGALLMVYGIYAATAIGSVLLAIGVKRLKRIEDI